MIKELPSGLVNFVLTNHVVVESVTNIISIHI